MDLRCYYCGFPVTPEASVPDKEFHQDGVYCSKECLRKQMKEEEERLAEMDEN